MCVQVGERSATAPAGRDSGDLRAVPFDDLAFSPLHRTKRSRVGSRKAVPNHVVGIIDVLFQVVPESAGECLPAGMEQLGPGITSQDRIGNDDAGQRPERQPVAGISVAGTDGRRLTRYTGARQVSRSPGPTSDA